MTEPPIRVAVITVSDRAHAGVRADASGPAVAEAAERLLGASVSGVAVSGVAVVPDEPDRITAALEAALNERPRPDLVLTTGGTGLGPRDVTPEATAALIERPVPGLLEAARARTVGLVPTAILSRGISGAIGPTLVINLPGSPRGAVEVFEAVAGVLPHAVAMLRGGDHAGCGDG